MITGIRFVGITVTDLDQAIDFYVNRLGFAVRIEMPLPEGNRFIMLSLPGGGAHLVMSLPLGEKPHTPTSSISFETEDVQSTYEALSAKGVEFTRLPTKTVWGGVEALFTDPFGNSFLLQQGGF